MKLISREPQPYDEKGEEPEGAYRVEVSLLGKTRDQRTAEYGDTAGDVHGSIGETTEAVIDKVDYFEMSQGTTFQLTLIEAQE